MCFTKQTTVKEFTESNILKLSNPTFGAQSNKDDIYLSLHKAIVEQRLTPGTKLTEEVLASIYQVSRRRIRTILQQLASDRCVELIPNKGAFVAQPNPQEAKDVFAARIVLERDVIQNAHSNLKKDSLTQLENNIRLERTAILSNSRGEAIVYSGEFHLLLASIAGNRVIAEMLRDLIARTSLIIALYGSQETSLPLCSCDEHSHILDSLQNNDIETSCQLMTQHLISIKEQLVLNTKPVEDVDLKQVLAF